MVGKTFMEKECPTCDYINGHMCDDCLEMIPSPPFGPDAYCAGGICFIFFIMISMSLFVVIKDTFFK